jgi:hypothetical protein
MGAKIKYTDEERKERRRIVARNNYHAHKERFRIQQKKYYLNNKNKWKDKDYIKKYNITLIEYNKLFKKQKGCCAICKKHQSLFKRSLAIDHNHETGVIRDLLCSNCNHMLGHSFENLNVLETAIKYLKKWSN